MRDEKRILIVDDEASFRTELARLFIRQGYRVADAANGKEALEVAALKQLDVVLLDIVLPDIFGIEVLESLKERSPDTQVIIITANATVNNAIASMKLGAFDYLTKPLDQEELTLLVERAAEFASLRRDSKLLHHELERQRKFDEFIASDPKSLNVLELVEKVAPTDSTVLVTGETGTGKELIAKAIHRKGPRRRKPFVVVNCSAMQETLLESEMFGYVRGAFTGALKDKSGLIEVASTGTLFLDEVGELSPALQTKLLRFLESGEYRPVGNTTSLRADVRVIAATNRDLKELMQEGRFRDDLYYRLNVINIPLPPLRERPRDIPRLVEYFLRKTCSRMGKCIKKIDREALDMLIHYPWPGNVRELENVLERAMILASSDSITVRDLPADLSGNEKVVSGQKWRANSLESVEREHVLRVLHEAAGNKTQAAKILGITKKTLYAKLRAYGIHP